MDINPSEITKRKSLPVDMIFSLSGAGFDIFIRYSSIFNICTSDGILSRDFMYAHISIYVG